MKRMIGGAGACLILLTAATAFGQQETAFFRIVSPAHSAITALSAGGTLSWTNGAAVGVTCTVQRATALEGAGNWVDYVRHEATNAAMALWLFDPKPPEGMALIPAGIFQMGDNLDGSTSAQPVHTVYVGAFYMDKTEVTWAKWQEVRTWAAANGYDIGSVGSGKADSHPVHSVNWYDCVKWLNARSQMEGLTACYRRGGAVYKAGEYDDITCDWSVNGYRLSTEAEWEKAARGGLSGKRFPWGDTIQHCRANYYSSTSYSYDTSPTRGYHPTFNDAVYPCTSPAGAFSPNGYGLYDMAGNVWEWCWDWYGSTYYSSSPGSDPRGPSSGACRVSRGGGWNGGAGLCRSAYRYGYGPPASRGSFLGFRPVRRAP